jgi:hypothetical protein
MTNQMADSIETLVQNALNSDYAVPLMIMDFLINGYGVLALFFLSICAFVIAWRSKRPVIRYPLYLTSAFLFLSPIATLLILVFFFNPLQDDGPFEGIRRAACASEAPQQIFKINSGRTVEVNSPKDEERAPTVLLRAKDGEVVWCIYATGQDFTIVRNITFSSFSEGYISGTTTLKGIVDWTFGRETTTWEIDEDGRYAYWYAW